MAHLLTVTFSRDSIQTLLDLEPDRIKVISTLEEVVLKDGSSAGVVRVKAVALREGSEDPLGTVDGCPDPPCG